MTGSSSKWMAWIVAGIALLLMTAGIVMTTTYLVWSGNTRPLLLHQILIPLITLAYAYLGGLVAARRPANPIGWLLLSVSLFGGLNALSVGYPTLASSLGTGNLDALNLAAWLGRWVWIPGVILPTVFLFLYFPDGRLPSSRWRPLAWIAGGGFAGLLLAVMFHPNGLSAWGFRGGNPYGLADWEIFLEGVLAVSTVLLLVSFIGSILAVSVRYRRSRGVARRQMKWLVYACGWFVISFAAGAAFGAFWPGTTMAQELSIIITDLAILGIAAAAVVAILRHNLYDVDRVISRTLVYGALTASVAGLYAVVVGGVSVSLQTERSYAALILTGALGAVLLRPLYRFYQNGADRLISYPVLTDLDHENERASVKEVHKPALSRLLAGAVRLWPWFAGSALLIVFISLPGYVLGLGEGPPDMVASRSGSAGFIFAMDLLNMVVSLLSVALAFALGILLYRRKRDEPMALYLAYYLLIYAIIIAGPLEEIIRLVSLPLDIALRLEAIIMVAPTILFLFLFPTGRFVPSWTRWLALASLAIPPLYLKNAPFVSIAFDTLSTWVGVAVSIVLGFAGVGAQVYRYRRVSTPEQRQQTKIAVAGFVLWTVVLALASVAYVFRQEVLATDPMPWWGPVSELLWFVNLGILPAALGVAVLSYGLWKIDVLINRALVYSALTGTIILLYILIVGGLGFVFQARGNFLVSLLATGLVAVLFQPLRERLQKGVNRLLYGDRDDPYEVLNRMGERLESSLVPQAVLPTIVETIAQALKLPYTGIAFKNETGFDIVTYYGLSGGEKVELPLHYRGEQIGKLICGTRSPEDPFTKQELELLKSIARQVGVAAHAVRLTEDLKKSRERLVLAREEERRRLRRDLHDGIGPELASVGLKVEAARNLLRQDPEKAEQLLVSLRTQVHLAVGDIRRLVYDLRPPALDELGLVSAVRQSGSLQSPPEGLTISVECHDELPPLPAAVEVAAYRIALEGVTNVVRHAAATQCVVRFSCGDQLELEIVDDGCGMEIDTYPGIGLTSMRERAAELGGEVLIDSLPARGTKVLARLPVVETDA